MVLQNLKDVFKVYDDSVHYEISWWNHVDFQNMTIWFDGSGGVALENGKIILSCTAKPKNHQLHNYIKTIEDLSKFIKYTRCLVDETEVVFVNKDNYHLMHATFAGSSNKDKKICFTLGYVGNYNNRRSWWRLLLFKCKYKIKKYINRK